MEEKIALSVENLGFKYGPHTILDQVSFGVRVGSYVGILGPNGGGKTTLLKLILGLLMPAEGKIKIFGIEQNQYKNKWEIGYVPQRAAQENINFPATVEEVVASGRTASRPWWKQETQEDIAASRRALRIARIEKYEYHLISQLSGGERQRVYVARALAAEPKILILDEPFVGLDVESQAEFYTFLKELNEKNKMTILFVSHDVDVISKEVDEVICLNRRLVCSGPPEETINKNVIEDLYGKRVTHVHHDMPKKT